MSRATTTTPKSPARRRGVAFGGEAVRAFLAGNKTQFRVPLKPQPPKWIDRYSLSADPRWWIPSGVFIRDTVGFLRGRPLEVRDNHTPVRCPFGAPGDVIWVKETWQYNGCETAPDGSESWHITYRADPQAEQHSGMGWRSPATMPAWASRLTLAVVAVRVERLQDITEADCWAEGCPLTDRDLIETTQGPLEWFREQWDARHGRGAWEANPWCWCATVRVLGAATRGGEGR